ncbi:hypothetical protein CRENPOLYSF1_360001 [Crenothrix polyspora]|uniref:Uncharacterized protein n=1 Tax=Crenothrix polyspora TaxID=360316 RepID=A0A1R4H9W0_9GAMM|nr:hypothetical protein CRENPOLYSF1_360001 [Crenothrix polyspora]
MCRSCFDKLSTNGGCNCSKLKTLYHYNLCQDHEKYLIYVTLYCKGVCIFKLSVLSTE